MRISSWTSRGVRLAAVGVGLSAAVLLPAAPGWAAGASPVPGVPVVSDDPTTVTNLPGQAPPMSAQMLAADAAKIATAHSFYSALAAGTTVRQGAAVTPMASTSMLLAATQQTQQQGAWCGPASVSESLNQVPGASHLTQAQAATALGTDPNTGTNWSGGPTGPTGYPVVDVMNAHVPAGDTYVAHAVGSVTSTEIANYENVLVYDVYNFSHPLIGDQYLVHTSAYTLAGEPNPPVGGQTLHWWNIRGYGTSSLIGDITYYEDSAWTAYGSTSATAVVTMVSGRGVVW